MDGSRIDDFEAPLTVRVARTMDDVQKIAVVRALVYMREQACPYEEEFDGNDLAGATHLIAEAGAEPLGCLRLRWFNGFAKVERVCVREGHRSGKVAKGLMAEAVEVIRRKGYTRFIGQVQAHLVPYWKRYGFIHRSERGVFVFSDRAYAEMEAIYDAHPDALTADTDPLVLDRPEGEWDSPGPLDRSAERGACPAQYRDRNGSPVPKPAQNAPAHKKVTAS
ncbi:MAG: GNAT family N-acetyltransferase [Alphaproteobacteria bacterium]|nr:GNAT family N-acetyltransferase [Alphaproteobacteria bacterium]